MKKIASMFLLSVLLPVHVFASDCVDISNNLSIGSRNSQVSTLQTYLIDSGLLSSPATGYFGNLTLTAVKLYQGLKMITQSGFVGPLTRQAIQKETCTTTTAQNTNPIVCTAEARLCPDGRAMKRSTSTCVWDSNSCTVSTTISTSTTTSITGSTWDPKLAKPLSESVLNSLKSALQSVGFNVATFATTTMSEEQIMQLTRKFEQDYIIGK
jgi:hypothetical protein